MCVSETLSGAKDGKMKSERPSGGSRGGGDISVSASAPSSSSGGAGRRPRAFFFLRSIKVHPNKTSDFEALTLAKHTQMQITDKNVTMAFNLKSSC